MKFTYKKVLMIHPYFLNKKKKFELKDYYNAEESWRLIDTL